MSRAIFFLHLLFILPNVGLTTHMTMGQMRIGEHRTWVQNARQIPYTMASFPEICVQKNIRATARGNIGQSTDKGHAPSPRIEIKIPDPNMNRTWTAGLEGRDSYRPRHYD